MSRSFKGQFNPVAPTLNTNDIHLASDAAWNSLLRELRTSGRVVEFNNQDKILFKLGFSSGVGHGLNQAKVVTNAIINTAVDRESGTEKSREVTTTVRSEQSPDKINRKASKTGKR